MARVVQGWSRVFSMVVFATLIVAPGPLEAQALRVEARFGQIDGGELDVWGGIEDAVFGRSGTLVVLDGVFKQMRVLSAEGDVLQVIGREGRGPGELFVPEALALQPSGVLLLDRGNARITSYTWTDDRLVIDREIPLRLQAWDLCEAGGHLFVASDETDQPVVEVNLRGDIQRRLGQLPSEAQVPARAHPNLQQRIRHRWRQGHLSCTANEVAWVSTSAGVVSRYSMAGAILEERALPDFDPITPTLTQRGTIRYGPEPGLDRADVVVGLTRDGDDLLVAVNRTVFGSHREYRTYRVPRGGQKITVLTGLDAWVHAASQHRILASVSEPFPQLLVATMHN